MLVYADLQFPDAGPGLPDYPGVTLKKYNEWKHLSGFLAL
jgi:hypothetical protein